MLHGPQAAWRPCPAARSASSGPTEATHEPQHASTASSLVTRLPPATMARADSAIADPLAPAGRQLRPTCPPHLGRRRWWLLSERLLQQWADRRHAPFEDTLPLGGRASVRMGAQTGAGRGAVWRLLARRLCECVRLLGGGVLRFVLWALYSLLCLASARGRVELA